MTSVRESSIIGGPTMSRMSDLRTQYQAMMTNAPEAMTQFYTGILMGLDLAAGASAEDRVEELKGEKAQLQAQVANGSTPSWKRESPAGTRPARDPNKETTIFGIVDPRNDEVFYVGASQDPQKQLRDYIRSDDMNISCKPTLNEIVGAGLEPGLSVLETNVKVIDASARKEAHMALLREAGAILMNQRS